VEALRWVALGAFPGGMLPLLLQSEGQEDQGVGTGFRLARFRRQLSSQVRRRAMP
jgi:hypothetical protein